MSDDAYDLGAEQSLLGSVLLAPAVASPALLQVPADAWWRPRHAEIATVLADRLRREEPVDPQVVLPDLMARRGFGQDTASYLLTLMERAWAPGNAAYYAERILHCYGRRSLAQAAARLRQRLDQSWVNGGNEPIAFFTAETREALDAAEALDGDVDETPSPTLDHLLATEETFDWLVPGLLERGERLILTGMEGLGKSWLISQFAATLAAGLHPFTGSRLGYGDKDYSLRVLIVDCENGVSQTRRRFRSIASKIDVLAEGNPAWRKNMMLEIKPIGLDLLGRDIGWLERRVELAAPDVLVIGPIYRLHYSNINDELAARGLVQALDRIRTRHHCALLSEAHPGHAEDGVGQRRMRPAGSSLFMRWPEFGYGLRRIRGDDSEHPQLVDVVAWRGSREERQWPRQLKHGAVLPWQPADDDYWEYAG